MKQKRKGVPEGLFPPGPPPSRATFGTGDVARILNLPIWRVQKFLDSPKYNLSPQGKLGEGHGSRRLFTREDILRIAIAARMLEDGCTAKFIGLVLEQIEDHDLRPSQDNEGREMPPPAILGVLRGGKGPLVRFYNNKLQPHIAGDEAPYYLFNLDGLMAETDKRIAGK